MTAIAHHPHPVTRAVAGVRDHARPRWPAVPLWSMDPAETTARIDEVQAAEAQLAELEARLLAHADRIEIAAPHRRHLDRELARRHHPHHPARRTPDAAARHTASRATT